MNAILCMNDDTIYSVFSITFPTCTHWCCLSGYDRFICVLPAAATYPVAVLVFWRRDGRSDESSCSIPCVCSERPFITVKFSLSKRIRFATTVACWAIFQRSSSRTTLGPMDVVGQSFGMTHPATNFVPSVVHYVSVNCKPCLNGLGVIPPTIWLRAFYESFRFRRTRKYSNHISELRKLLLR